MAHWIAVTSRAKNQKFRCSECGKECHCIAVGNGRKHGQPNYCNYRFCPNCGKEIAHGKITTEA